MGSKKENQTRTDRKPGKRGSFERNRKTILYRDNFCAICGRPVDKSLPPGLPLSPEVDHIIPVSRGGDPTSLDNLQLVHKACNQAKGDKMPNNVPDKPKVNNRDLPLSMDWVHYRAPKDDNEA